MTASGLALSARPAPRPGAAWRAGWRSFWKSPEPVLAPILLAGAAWVVLQVLLQALVGVDGTGDALVAAFAFFFLGQLYWAVALRAGLAALGGTPAPLRRAALPVLTTAAVLALALALGVGFLLVPAVLIGLGTQFAMVSVVADGLGCFAAIADSIVRVVTRPGTALLAALLGGLTLVGGAGALVVGLWPATAVLALAHLHLHGVGADATVGAPPDVAGR